MLTDNVYLFVPNIIGYVRIILAIIAFSMWEDYVQFYILYFISAWLDVLDGHAARYFNQTSKFGAVLDMFTDRCSTAALLVLLATLYPQFRVHFAALVAIDFASHYAHMQASLMSGKQSHKSIDTTRDGFMTSVMRIYYHNRLVLGFMCAGTEGFYLSLYAFNFMDGPHVMVPGLMERPMPFFFLFTAACFPVMIVKNIINIIQFVYACSDIAAIDTEARAPSASKRARTTAPPRRAKLQPDNAETREAAKVIAVAARSYVRSRSASPARGRATRRRRS